LFVTNLAGQFAELEAGVAQPSQRFGCGVAVGLEAARKSLKKASGSPRALAEAFRRIVLQLLLAGDGVAEPLHGVDGLCSPCCGHVPCRAWYSTPQVMFFLSSRRFALVCTTITAAVPPTAASTTAAASAVTAGFRLHQSHARLPTNPPRRDRGRESSQGAGRRPGRRGVTPPRIFPAFQIALGRK
jgi:hypothetical protein